MSIKKLFENTPDNNRTPAGNKKDIFDEVESSRNVSEKKIDQETFVPHVDYSKPENFVTFGSARLYYDSALTRITDYYPYDGSEAETNEFLNKSLNIEKYILEKRYPRSTGYITFSPTSAEMVYNIRDEPVAGYVAPKDTISTPPVTNNYEYIDFFGGPGTGSAKSLAFKDLMPNPNNSSNKSSNIYDENIYKSAGLPDDYGTGTRESNLRANFDDGVTVEFWMKTGSIPDGAASAADKPRHKWTVFDMWNTEETASADNYARLRIELTGAVDNSGNAQSPFAVSVCSGSDKILWQTIGDPALHLKMGEWNHYAITMYNTASSFDIRLYVNGQYNASASVGEHGKLSMNELNPNNMMGRLGALAYTPAGSWAGSSIASEIPSSYSSLAGWGKLSGSLDEFRYWKTKRTAKQIGMNWFTQIRGGVNSDVSNADLGVYFKFNEGITGDAGTDKIVLDYSGRACNGTWTGYYSADDTWNGIGSRQTASALTSSYSPVSTEFRDPIIRTNHPDYISLKNELYATGSSYDYNNNSSIFSLVPSWIQELDSENEDSDFKNIAHIMGVYFDNLKLQIKEISKLKFAQYPSASYKPYPMSEHLPQSLGLYTPQLFIDSTIVEKFLNRNESGSFAGDLEETKDMIYQNLYNNLAYIYKSKGTERAIRNVLRCFNIGDDTLSLRISSDNEEFELRNNLRQTTITKNFINFNSKDNSKAIVYQRSASLPEFPHNDIVTGSIRGSTFQQGYGLTYEGNFLFPSFTNNVDTFVRDGNYNQISLFGFKNVDTAGETGAAATDAKNRGTDLEPVATDRATLRMYAIRDSEGSKNVRFHLTSDFAAAIDDFSLTSETFFDVYDDRMWNISVRIEPQKMGAQFITGSVDTKQSYNVIFSGYSPRTAGTYDSFKETTVIPASTAIDILTNTKRPYVGADRLGHHADTTGITTIDYRCDVLAGSISYYLKSLSDDELLQHAYDIENIGVTGSYQDISPFDPSIENVDVKNSDMLVLNWNFDNVTGSNADGTFNVLDYSSGSIHMAKSSSWVGLISGKVNPGYGRFFGASSTDAVVSKQINTYKFIDPEQVVASDMVQLFSDDDVMFPNLRRSEIVPNYVFSFEKSLYSAVSEQILDFFAGATDFHNIIGRPVNRYRGEYKEMEKLRETFFRRVKEVATVEKFVQYYRWFDESISQIISQLVPASSEFSDDIPNVIESHVLERNKYKNIVPIFDSDAFTLYSPTLRDSTPMFAYGEMHLSAEEMSLFNPPASPRDTRKGPNYWRKRADRTDANITSGDANIDAQRNTFRDIMYARPTLTSSVRLPKFKKTDGTGYSINKFARKNYGQVNEIKIKTTDSEKTPTLIKSGINYRDNKKPSYVMTAVSPAGPVNKENGVFVPLNVLLGFVSESVQTTKFINSTQPANKVVKENKIFKVQLGREWQDGLGYQNIKSTISFPFNVYSSSIEVSTGFNKQVVERVGSNIEITNIHSDGYGEMHEVPLQGTFTQHTVGGHQSRHVPLNEGADSPTTRPEAWRILLGTCGTGPMPPNAIGIVGPDYPPPEYNPPAGTVPYPYKPHQKAYLYRDVATKRPVNIRNIYQKTGSGGSRKTLPGNYQNQYEVVHSFGASTNARKFIDNQITKPAQATDSNLKETTNMRTFLSRHRSAEGHFDFIDDYDTGYLTGTTNQTIITNRFSAPGGIEVQSRGFQDYKASEFSPYNSLGYRNLGVIKPSQGPSGTISEPHGGTPSTSRVYDIHGKDYGLNSHYARHSAKFGRDSVLVTSPGASYEELPSFHKRHRNRKERMEISGTRVVTFNTNKDISNTLGIYLSASSGASTQYGKLVSDGPFIDVDGNSWTGKQFTLSIWLYREISSYSATQTILSLGDNNGSITNDVALGWEINNSEQQQFAIQTSKGNKVRWAQSNAVPQNAWTHLAVVFDGSTAATDPTLYMNGVSQSVTRTGGPTTSSMEGINSVGGGNSYIGTRHAAVSYGTMQETGLDELAIYNITMSANKVYELYASGGVLNLTSTIAPYTSSLVTWLRFGQVSDDPSTNAQLTGSGSPNHTGSTFHDFMTNNHYHIKGGSVGIGANDYGVYMISSSNTVGPDVLPTASILDSYEETVYHTRSVYDNLYVQHPIPRSDRQYMWLSRSVIDGGQLRYAGYQNTYDAEMYEYRTSSAGLEEYWQFVSASEAYTGSFFQPANNLNIILIDPVDDDNATLGSTTIEINEELVGTAPTAVNPDYLNQLLNKRGQKYGWGWNKLRQNDHPLLRKQRRENELIIQKDLSSDSLTKYNLPPVSLKGRPLLVNVSRHILTKYDQPTVVAQKMDATFRVTNTNEIIYFNDKNLNELTNVPYTGIYRSRDALLGTAGASFKLNWILYSQNIFPSIRNEFISGTERPSYDNQFWRDEQIDRTIVGEDLPNSQGYDLAQSSWVLDPTIQFLTRSGLPTGGGAEDRDDTKAGELQNTYYRYFRKSANHMRPGALYARCHTLDTPSSVASPQYGPVPETGSRPGLSASFVASSQMKIFGSGEALWEAADQAGYQRYQVRRPEHLLFISASNNPWWNNYDSFQEDLKLKAKGFAVVPEFRISEKIAEYSRVGVATAKYTGANRNLFTIPGTDVDSQDPEFYLDYSNTDFLQDFLHIRRETFLNAKQIRLKCTGAIRYNPYKGFYPAQRTIDLVSQFSRSFVDAIAISQSFFTAMPPDNVYYGNARDSRPFNKVAGFQKQLTDPLWSPGILYNSIKSGMAVDYPVVHDGTKIKLAHYGDNNNLSNNWALTITGSKDVDSTNGTSKFLVGMSGTSGYHGGQFWDRRIPFEAIIRPRSFLPGFTYQNMEAHPSMSMVHSNYDATCSFADVGDNLYNLMARNFFGESATFFLRESSLTTLKSNTITDDLQFKKGEVYMSRIKLRRSHNGRRTYNYDYDTYGNKFRGGVNGEIGTGVVGFPETNSCYGTNGARAYMSGSVRDGVAGRGRPLLLQEEFPLPQDPKMNPYFQETFTMYSRPSAFGPAVAGRPTGSAALNVYTGDVGFGTYTASFEKAAFDSFEGYNPAFTPPYTNGEAWVDLIFRPSASIAYDLERILAETQVYCWRFDAGAPMKLSGSTTFKDSLPKPGVPALIPVQQRENTKLGKINDTSPNDDNTIPSPYDGFRINVNSMQVTSSIDIFGVERVLETKIGGNSDGITNKTVGQKWLIRPKWETPMLNFANVGSHPISSASQTLTLPNWGSESVPRGMWHQFGVIPEKADVGVFMEISEIPLQWLKNHYKVVNTGSIYNNFNVDNGKKVATTVKSLAKLCGFDKTNNSKRLGEIKDKMDVFEAVVAVPYVTLPIDEKYDPSNSTERYALKKGQIAQHKKKFVSIPKKKWDSAMRNMTSPEQTSVSTLARAMAKYVFPPQFDCLNNPLVSPIAMYVFEFKYTFDQDDLSYIWQNTAPRDSKRLKFQTSTVTHNLNNNELISEKILTNENLRWMVFKVKQRAFTDYYDLLVDQAGQSTRQIGRERPKREYPLKYNWPYDYLSFVELIKMDVDILLKK